MDFEGLKHATDDLIRVSAKEFAKDIWRRESPPYVQIFRLSKRYPTRGFMMRNSVYVDSILAYIFDCHSSDEPDVVELATQYLAIYKEALAEYKTGFSFVQDISGKKNLVMRRSSY